MSDFELMVSAFVSYCVSYVMIGRLKIARRGLTLFSCLAYSPFTFPSCIELFLHLGLVLQKAQICWAASELIRHSTDY